MGPLTYGCICRFGIVCRACRRRAGPNEAAAHRPRGPGAAAHRSLHRLPDGRGRPPARDPGRTLMALPRGSDRRAARLGPRRGDGPGAHRGRQRQPRLLRGPAAGPPDRAHHATSRSPLAVPEPEHRGGERRGRGRRGSPRRDDGRHRHARPPGHRRGQPVPLVRGPCRLPDVLDTCVTEWRDLADHPDLTPRFQEGALVFECARAFIRHGSTLVGMVLAGGVSPSTDETVDPDLHHLDDDARRRVLTALPGSLRRSPPPRRAMRRQPRSRIPRPR